MNTRALTEGALLTAVTVIVSLLSYYVPFTEILLFFMPVPTILLCIRQGIKTAVLSGVAAILLSMMFMSPVSAILSGVTAVLPGILLGFSYLKKQNGFRRLIAGYVAYLLCLFLSIYLTQVITGIGFIEDYTNLMKESTNMIMEVYQSSGVISSDQLTELSSEIDSLTQTMMMMLPAMLLILPFLMSWAACTISDFILKKLHVAYRPIKPFYTWVMPLNFRVFICLVLLISVLLASMNTSISQIYIQTLETLCMTVFVIDGLSFASWLTVKKMKKGGKLVRALIILGIFILPGMINLICYLGVADTAFDFRKRMGEKIS